MSFEKGNIVYFIGPNIICPEDGAVMVRIKEIDDSRVCIAFEAKVNSGSATSIKPDQWHPIEELEKLSYQVLFQS